MRDSPPRAFLPNFCAIRMVFAVVVSAELLAIVLTLGAFPSADQFWTELSLRSLYIQWITLSVAALYCGLRVPLSRLSHAWAGILAWLLICDPPHQTMDDLVGDLERVAKELETGREPQRGEASQ